MGRAGFRVDTVELDLPQLTGALSTRLREAGLPVTPDRAAGFARALAIVQPVSRTRLYWTARAVFVSDPAQVRAFDAVFFGVFGGAAPLTGPPADAASSAAPAGDERPAGRPAEAGGPQKPEPALGWSSSSAAGAGEDRPPIPVPLAMASDEERLGGKRFDQLDAQELAQLSRLMSQLRLATPTRTARRHRPARRGRHVDMRRTLRGSLRTGGDPARLSYRRRRAVPRRLVMLCDISGSMEPYARAYLQFLTCAAASGPNAEAFVFATRLTRLTRALSSRNPERAIQRAAESAPDWSSGTRIGDALKSFNDLHGRRGMARGAVVVILSDGWERGDPELVGREMARLARLAHRIVWVNPRAGAGSFSVRAGGMVAALPHCDALVSGHNFRALGRVIEAIGAESTQGLDEARWSAPADVPGEPEPWASATPVPGSSVAMPSGHGPRKGRTTAGWVSEEVGEPGG
jgi:uncharacterized protein